MSRIDHIRSTNNKAKKIYFRQLWSQLPVFRLFPGLDAKLDSLRVEFDGLVGVPVLVLVKSFLDEKVGVFEIGVGNGLHVFGAVVDNSVDLMGFVNLSLVFK